MTRKTLNAAAGPDGLAPVKAVFRINGSILPGTIFYCDSPAQRAELMGLEAIEELDELDMLIASRTKILSLAQLSGSDPQTFGGLS
ncbi:hypothetical protein SLG_17520 [Sphingobium sp. SYK-6]|uniref:hypothetical protein n=1 Tax=Sphingobium sp. (strain NBRC 103272 / SYK-6) TaxID=627192 RepID=UPI0002277215|nr:hypothetical protein [Sphingobium sp. SYK-6]BAK66427.1 hypothetical protein SLG_17520 [Sphingobium sp. SYK-6]